MRHLKKTIVVIATLALLISSQMVALASQASKDFIAGPDRLEFLKVLSATATLELRNGNVVSFVAIPGENGHTEAVAIVEEIAPDQRGLSSVKRLRDANPLEVFNALSERGAEYPRLLLQTYGKPILGPQGWALGELTHQDPGIGYVPPCPSWGVEGFNDALDFGMTTYSHYFKSTWDGPNAKPGHWHLPANGGLGNGVATRDLYGSAHNVTAFSAAVVLCHTDEYNYVDGEYAGNYVNVKFRNSNINAWLLYEAGQLDEEGKVVSAQLHPADYAQPSAVEFDFRLEILNAEMNDLFHIGATWNEKANNLTIGQ